MTFNWFLFTFAIFVLAMLSALTGHWIVASFLVIVLYAIMEVYVKHR